GCRRRSGTAGNPRLLQRDRPIRRRDRWGREPDQGHTRLTRHRPGLRCFLSYVIMWHVNMSQLTSKHDLDGAELQTAPEGFVFDPRIREVLKRQGRRVEPGTEALAAVRILGKKLHAGMERWAERFGLSEGRFQILVRLHHQPSGRFTMGELAETLDITPRTVTGLVDNLERDGLVRRV